MKKELTDNKSLLCFQLNLISQHSDCISLVQGSSDWNVTKVLFDQCKEKFETIFPFHDEHVTDLFYINLSPKTDFQIKVMVVQ